MYDANRPPNRLIGETSPYLLQHARNPVDWHPWSEAAFAAAASQNKPVFLSIGYSACHWCHVMEHESFENDQIAAFLNEHFISIKVDREERPDVDAIYMNAVIAMTGHGGWPMSVFLTSDKRPFFGGTYWPPRSKMGMPGFVDVLQHVQHAWKERAADVERAAGELVNAIQAMGEPPGDPHALGEEVMRAAGVELLKAADRTHGGFGRAPKFPHAMDLRVLLRVWKRFGNQDALDVVVLTLDKMARGGLYDQLGGGFHRYSTDGRWLVPHFEKMLYDQALLIPAYLEAFQATGSGEFAAIVRETIDYISREMTSPGGGFYSTQDADSEGHEGRFFVWTQEDVESLLPADEAKAVCAFFDVSPEGNWEGHVILNRPKPMPQVASSIELPEERVRELLASARKTMFEARRKRVAPGRDEKLIVSWNGMMIAALSTASAVLNEPRYADQARAAADDLLNNLTHRDSRLLHTAKDGIAKLAAYLDDYAALADGLAELYQATGEIRWLNESLKLAEEMISHFAAADGGFYYTAADHEELIVRQRDSQDNATPSGNSLAATVLLKLGRITGRSDLEDAGIVTLDVMSAQIARSPLASGQALIALDFLLGPTKEIVLVGSADGTARLRRAVEHAFVPNKVVLTRDSEIPEEVIAPAVRPLVVGKRAVGDASAFICERGLCHSPVSTPEAVRDALTG